MFFDLTRIFWDFFCHNTWHGHSCGGRGYKFCLWATVLWVLWCWRSLCTDILECGTELEGQPVSGNWPSVVPAGFCCQISASFMKSNHFVQKVYSLLDRRVVDYSPYCVISILSRCASPMSLQWVHMVGILSEMLKFRKICSSKQWCFESGMPSVQNVPHFVKILLNSFNFTYLQLWILWPYVSPRLHYCGNWWNISISGWNKSTLEVECWWWLQKV